MKYNITMKTLKYIFILILLVSCSEEATTDSTENIDTYLYKSTFIEGFELEKIDGISSQFYQPFYYHNFNNGQGDWKTFSGEEGKVIFSVKFENGLYKMFLNKGGDYTYYNALKRRKNKGLYVNESFDAKIKFKYINEHSSVISNSSSEFAFIFGKERGEFKGIRCDLSIRYPDVSTSIGTVNGSSTSSWGYNKTNKLIFSNDTQTSEFNELLLRKVDDKFYVFLNGEVVNYGEAKSFRSLGGDFGFTFSNTDVAVAEIEIKKIIKQ